MTEALALLRRCRELREQAAQRARAHAALHSQQARADEAARRRAAAAEAERQFSEHNEMLHSLLRQDVMPQTMGALLERHGQRRELLQRRIDMAVTRCRHMDLHLEYAQQVCAQRSRALERAGHLVEAAAAQGTMQAQGQLEAAEDDFVATWSHRGRAGGAKVSP
jgi:hypothetical protein